MKKKIDTDVKGVISDYELTGPEMSKEYVLKHLENELRGGWTAPREELWVKRHFGLFEHRRERVNITLS